MRARLSTGLLLGLAGGLAASVFVGALVADAAPPPDAKGAKRDLKQEEKLRKDTLKVQARRSKRLEPLVKWALEKKLKKQAAELIEDISRATPEWKSLADLKSAVETCDEAEPAAADLKDFETRVKNADTEYANELMTLAKECVKFGLYTRAFDLIGDVLEANPEHAQARKIRGFVKVEGKWESKYDADMLKGTNDTGANKSKTKYVRFKDKDGVVQGWVPKADVPKWEQGLRPWGGDGKFVPEEEEIRQRRMNVNRGWKVESEHFLVQTNLSRAAAWEFSELLEEYYGQFFRTFMGFFDLEKGVELLFDVKPLKKKHVVLFLPSRNDYLNHVKEFHGNDQLLLDSAGFYSVGGSTTCNAMSHFFWMQDRSEVLSVTYHEVTHQLFAETKEGGERGGSKGNNWVPEGIASYIETWTKDGRGHWVPGGNRKHERLLHAKKALEANPGWKLSSFIAIDHDEFHKANRGLNYALSEALSHFLMHYDDERYKEDFVKFIAAYYGGKAKEGSLFDYLQIEGPESKRAELLEKQFKEYMAKLGED